MERIPCARGSYKDNGCPGELKYEDDEYGSLGSGGSYEIYRCDTCGRKNYFALPD